MWTRTKVAIPAEERETVDAYEHWTVRWWAMERTSKGNFGRAMPAMRVFPTEETVKRFAEELNAAIKLLQDQPIYGYERIEINHVT